MALIVRLPVRWIAALGVGMIATHNLLDRIDPASLGKFYWLLMILHTPGRIPITAHFSFLAGYALIPWVGVMAAGFAFGSLLFKPDRRKWILTLGLSLILLGLLDGAKAERGLGCILLVYGRVPLFFYVLHIYLIHVMAIVVALAFHQPVWHGPIIGGISPKPFGYGHGLLFIYTMWILTVAILYLPCRWFMELKRGHRDSAWLSYL
jgi:uncharacterized membrane protein